MAKPFSWSFSKLKNFETCPKKYYEVDVAKNIVEPVEPGGPLDWGNRVHQALAAALQEGKPLPDEMKDLQRWIDMVATGPGKLLVEQKYALTKDFKPTSWFNRDAWYRGIGDAVRLDPPVALVVDWKTGKVKIDHTQLMLMALCIFTHYPEIRRVRTEYVWIQEDCTTPDVFSRETVADEWVGLYDRVAQLENAHATQSFPPKPGGLCRSFCPVKTCPYWGKGYR